MSRKENAMRMSCGLIAIVLGLSAAATGCAQSLPVAIERAETHTDGKLTITSSAFQSGASIPSRHSAYADGISPQLKWSPVPGATSYALVVEDPDAKSPSPVLHWLTWNIPSTLTELPEGLRDVSTSALVQGRNTHGTNGYTGPHPPLGDPPHHYHFQVIAIDRMLAVPAGADLETVLGAAKGHVVAKGELVGTYQEAVNVGH
jgi:Raf kinase inhibitor-like YbhB/YbcL family protein